MRIDLRLRHIQRGEDAGDGVPAAAHVERRMLFAFSRFAHEIDSVTVVIEDVNGPKGGPDKRCALTARGPRIGTVFVEETGADAHGAVDLLAGRASRSVARALDRMRHRPSAADPRKP